MYTQHTHTHTHTPALASTQPQLHRTPPGINLRRVFVYSCKAPSSHPVYSHARKHTTYSTSCVTDKEVIVMILVLTRLMMKGVCMCVYECVYVHVRLCALMCAYVCVLYDNVCVLTQIIRVNDDVVTILTKYRTHTRLEGVGK